MRGEVKHVVRFDVGEACFDVQRKVLTFAEAKGIV